MVLLLLLLLFILATVFFVGSARALFKDAAEIERWQRVCCLAGLAFGLLGWLSPLAIVVCGVLAKGDFLMGLFTFGAVVTPIALVLGLTSSVKPGYLLAKAAAALGAFWLVLWFLTPRGV
jgi:hypothetical protein